MGHFLGQHMYAKGLVSNDVQYVTIFDVVVVT